MEVETGDAGTVVRITAALGARRPADHPLDG